MSIPSRFRDHIAQRYTDILVVTNFDRCLVAYPLEEWEALERKAAGLPQLKKEVKAFQRFFISGATECPIDKQGRILIPPTLRQYAGIGRNAVLVGLLKKFEIWSKERWQQEFAKSQKGFDDFSGVLGDLGL
jgi:MraZ protein